MQVKDAIPASTLTAISALLTPYCPDLSPTALVAALKAHGAEPARPTPIRRVSLHDWAEANDVSYWTARRLALSGRIPALKVGSQWRIPLQAVEELSAVEG